MAEVDFGDSELFQQLDDTAPVAKHIRFTEDDEATDETCDLRDKLEECEENMQRLTDENQILKRKLNILTSPSALRVEDVNTDGPLLQILYANNRISKQCRQEIEDIICCLIQRHQNQEKHKDSASQIRPQNSAFLLEEDQVKTSSGIKTVTEAFKVIGSVLYFTTFSIDKLGQPLLNENPQLTDGWEVPTYQQVFNQVIGTDGQEIEMKERRPKSMCFNCGSPSHQIRDCPKPKDQAAINERRREFSQNQGPAIGNQRYHAEVEERFAKYKPGVMSEELLSALGVGANTLPPLIYRMRQLGYPPGWLKEAEMENSGLTLYDGKDDGGTPAEANGQKISYDVSKLVDFPGFNVPASSKLKDRYLQGTKEEESKEEHMQYGSIPMQGNHMKLNFAAYLSDNFPSPSATGNKRRHEPDSTSQQIKKRRSSPLRNSDMDTESESGTPHRYQGSGCFQFQPPLPPGSPSFSSPPPLPQGTPPATPTPPPLPKGTPPPTPTNGSPALPGPTWVVVDEASEGMEDGLTLEELEEQQRLIWAALENADTATNSDSETLITGTSVPSSPSISTSAHVDTETEMDTEEIVNMKRSAEDIYRNDENQKSSQCDEAFESPFPVKSEGETPQSPVPIRLQEESPLSPGPIRSLEESPLSPGPIKAQEESPLSPGPIRAQEESHQIPGPITAQIESPLSPGPIRAQEESHQIPGPITAQMESPLSPGPTRAQEESPLSPGPTRAQEESPLSPGPIRAQEESPLSPGPIRGQEESPISPGPIRAQEESPISPDPIKAKVESPLCPGPMRVQVVKCQISGSIRAQEDSPFSLGPVGTQDDITRSPGPNGAQSPAPEPSTKDNLALSLEKVVEVPHRSKFAAGIVQFEDTPEYTEVAVATGTYLRIRDLLKSSPRNLSRSKK